jgi:hypothetical protein
MDTGKLMGQGKPTFSSFHFTVPCSQWYLRRGRNHLGLLVAVGKGGKRKGGEERCHGKGQGQRIRESVGRTYP